VLAGDDADHAAALAAANPADTAANARAIDAAAQAEAAHLAEMYAADKWASHVMHLHGLIAMTDELGCNPVPSPGPEGTTAAAATAPARIRSRADCLGRPG
jgi:hypothetical protein